MKLLRLKNLIWPLLTIVVLLALVCHRNVFRHLNVSTIISEGLDVRLIPHRVNRLDKLTTIINAGIRSLEVDLMFRYDGNRGFFEVGHDEADSRGIKIDRFLKVLKQHDPKKIWFDIKNINDDNIDAVNSELLRLDSLYGIKSIAVVESNITTDSFVRIHNSGFHTSYYLPTARISKLLGTGNETQLKLEADRIAEQIERQSVAAVSFSLAIYRFVKGYLEPVIPADIRYHTWDSVNLGNWNAVDRLEESDYFQDWRVSTIIYGF